ncbi:MAG: hypothetical protein ACFFDH_10745 [Promethearchaeota archaeon]
MEIQYSKMILHGILAFVSYIVIPFVMIYLLEYYNIMTFNESFRLSIIIFGIIGIVISILSHAFPEDTSANRLIRFGATIYSGIFIFYVFGGFEAGRSLGTYYINTPTIQVLLGLKLIAWLLLGSLIIQGLQYLIEAIELRKKKEYRVKVKKEFKLSKVFKVLGILASLGIVCYFGTVIFSGINLRVNIHDTFGFDYDPGVNPPPDFSDDSLDFTITFDVRNMGLYAINDVILSAEIHTLTTDNASALPWDIKIGGAPSVYQNTFHSFTETLNQDINLSIDTAYIKGLLTTNGNLLLKISFSTLYALNYVNVNVSLEVPWTHP